MSLIQTESGEKHEVLMWEDQLGGWMVVSEADSHEACVERIGELATRDEKEYRVRRYRIEDTKYSEYAPQEERDEEIELLSRADWLG